MKKQGSFRNPALDITRCFAFFCVVSIHFFKNSGLYEETVTGSKMYLMCLLRSGFMIAVPLFLLLSGYLMKDRQPTKQYYSKIWKTICIYILASICCGSYTTYASRVFWGEPVSVWSLILGIFSYSTAPYGWYVGMYIGLFLLIPYLNILYNQLDKKRKQYLILIFLFMTALPSVANIHNLTDLSWWLRPSSSSAYNNLAGDFWMDLYPITYYFIGAYLREYPLQIKRSTNVFLIILAFVAFGSFTFYRSYPGTYITGFWMESGSLLTTTQAVLVFNFLSQLNCEKFCAPVKKALAFLSDWCLGAYLVSWIFDEHFYSHLRDEVPVVLDRMAHFLPTVLKIFICSLALSAVLTTIYSIFSRILVRFRCRRTT